ncbi:MAG: FHA domain-containing protein, partial [Agromyces sp.]|nr:FHA domain-containing protein [Agromyces sp.]
MSELTLLVLQLGFLVLLWVFVFAIVYSLRSDLFGQRV